MDEMIAATLKDVTAVAALGGGALLLDVEEGEGATGRL